MSDILQAAAGTEITFRANTSRADKWMRDQFGSTTVTYRLPNVNQSASDFRNAARAAKLMITSLETS